MFPLDRDALKQQYNLGQYFLEVSIEDISSFDEMLAHKLQKQPSDNLPLVGLNESFIQTVISCLIFFS